MGDYQSIRGETNAKGNEGSETATLSSRLFCLDTLGPF